MTAAADPFAAVVGRAGHGRRFELGPASPMPALNPAESAVEFSDWERWASAYRAARTDDDFLRLAGRITDRLWEAERGRAVWVVQQLAAHPGHLDFSGLAEARPDQESFCAGVGDVSAVARLARTLAARQSEANSYKNSALNLSGHAEDGVRRALAAITYDVLWCDSPDLHQTLCAFLGRECFDALDRGLADISGPELRPFSLARLAHPQALSNYFSWAARKGVGRDELVFELHRELDAQLRLRLRPPRSGRRRRPDMAAHALKERRAARQALLSR